MRNWYEHTPTQNLYRKLCKEIVNLYGVPCFYLKKTVVGLDPLNGEAQLLEFNSYDTIKLFLENFNFYEGQNQLFNIHGVTFNDEMRFTVEILQFADKTGLDRPQEGDLIAFKISKAALSVANPNNHGYEIYEIKGVEARKNFFAHGTMFLEEIFCEKFTVGGATFNTGLTDLDAAMTLLEAYDQGDNSALIEAASSGVMQYDEALDIFKANQNLTQYNQEDFTKMESFHNVNLIPLKNVLVNYRFEENSYSGSGGEVKDNSDAGNDGTASTEVTTDSSSGILSRYAVFNQEPTSFVTCPLIPDNSILTIAYWVKFNSFNTMTDLNVIGSKKANANLYLGVDGYGYVSAGYGKYEAGTKVKVFSGIASDKWTRLLMTYSVPEKIVFVYLNGNILAQFESTWDSTTGAVMTVGALNDDGTVKYHLDANIDEFVVSKDFWDYDKITADWNNGIGRIIEEI